jgi:hypothetical protein
VDGCGSPYLTWHHFDPPWSVAQHHDPAGMIALCRDHHPEADAGAFTVDQLREMKRAGRDRNKLLGAKFNWMREDLIPFVGGVFYAHTPIAIQILDMPVVWFRRDERGRLLVNLQLPSQSNEPRIAICDNFWMTEGSDERRVVCPPSGKLVSASYPNGDRLKVEFREITTPRGFDHQFAAKLPAGASHSPQIERAGLAFPLAVVEVSLKIAGTGIELSPSRTKLGTSTIGAGWMIGCGVGIQIGNPNGRSQPSGPLGPT